MAGTPTRLWATNLRRSVTTEAAVIQPCTEVHPVAVDPHLGGHGFCWAGKVEHPQAERPCRPSRFRVGYARVDGGGWPSWSPRSPPEASQRPWDARGWKRAQRAVRRELRGWSTAEARHDARAPTRPPISLNQTLTTGRAAAARRAEGAAAAAKRPRRAALARRLDRKERDSAIQRLSSLSRLTSSV
jgi:hypothetical protein